MSANKSVLILEKLIKYSKDAIKYINNITYDEFIGDEKTLVFCVFSLSQMGELVGKLDANITNMYPTIPWKELRGLRNRIVHDYDGVQYRIVWNILTNHIPPLIIDLQVILEDIKTI